MRSRNPFSHGAATLLIVLAGLIPAAASAEDRPNIVVILCDDLGYGDLASYGHPHIQTPHLDQMAREGIRFTDMYSAAPVCSPARVGLLTGRSPNRAGVYDFIRGGSDIHLRPNEVTFPQLLQKAGYATCLSGKWHGNGKFNAPEQPQPDAAGFDHWFATQNNARPSHANPDNFVRNGEPVGPTEGYSCQLVVDEALGWLTTQQENDPEQPFFMYVAFHEPHEPVASPPDLVEGYRDVTRNENEAEYFANVTNLDRAVGTLLASLKDRGLDDNTLVVFTSDNGPETLNRYSRAKRSYGVATPLRGMKLWSTEAGFRVPGIMRWPGTILPGQVSPQVVSSLDFLPTFTAVAGTKPPADLVLDGTHFLPALKNQPPVRPHPLLWVFYNALNERRVAMRDGDWKVLARLNLERFTGISTDNADAVKQATLSDLQIFRVTDDVSESHDLSASHSEKLSELKQRLESRYRDLVEDSYVWDSPK